MRSRRESLTAAGNGSGVRRALRAAVAATALAGCADRGEWFAGWARVEITPPFATPLAGYSARGSAPARGTHDALFARAVVLADGRGNRVAIVACDLIGISRELKAAVLTRLSRSAGIDGDRLLLCATHTHAGPGGVSTNPLVKVGAGDYDERVLPYLGGRIAAVIEQAGTALTPCRLRTGEGWVDGLSKNRRRADGPVDRRLDVLVVTPDSAAPGVLLVHYAMHPTVLPASQMEYSADFPGAMARTVESAGYALGMFINGAEGDQAPVAVPGATPLGAVQVIGSTLARQALRIAAAAGPELAPAIRVRTKEVPLPASVFAAYVPRAARVQVIELGSLLLYAVPGEPVAEVGTGFHLLARRMGCHPAWLVSLANDHLGYFDTPAGFALNSYESNLTFHGPDSAAALLDALPGMTARGETIAAERGRAQATRRDAARAAASVERRGGGWFLKVSGSPREMGFEHGTLLAAPIRAEYEAFQEWLNTQAREGLSDGVQGLAPLASVLRPAGLLVPWLAVKARELQPFIAPDLLEEIAGIAEGSGIPYDGVLLMNVFLTQAEQEDRARWFLTGPRGTCTNLVCLPPRAAGEVLHARNLDWGMEGLLPKFAAVILYEPAGGVPFVSVGWAGIAGTLTAMNGEGLSVTEESVAARGDTVYHGEPIMLLMRRVIQHARSLREAVRAFVGARGTCGYHITVADGRTRDARVVERSAHHATVRHPAGGELPGVVLARAASAFDGGRMPASAIPRSDATSDRRYTRLTDRLREDSGPLSPKRLQAMLGDAAIAGPGTLHSVVLLPGRFAAWIAHGTVPATAGPYAWFDFTREVTRHRLLGSTRTRLRTLFGPSDGWERIDEPVQPAERILEAAGPGRPCQIALAVMPSTVISPVRENNTLYAKIYEPPGAAAATMIFLPMWWGHERDAEDVIARALARRGFRIALMPMAYQWWRRPPGVRSGGMTVSADPARTRAALAQTFADVERLARWLTVRNPGSTGRLGIMGLSLGAFVASSVFAVDPQFRCGVFVLAGGDAAGALFSGAPDVAQVRAALQARGATRASVRREYGLLSPATLADAARGERVLLVNAVFDQVVSRGNAEDLARAWGHPARFWVPGGHHTAILFLDPFLDRCDEHLRRWLVW